MKKLLALGLGVGLLLTATGMVAFAAEDDQTVTVTVNAVESITASGTVADVTTRNQPAHTPSGTHDASIAFTTDWAASTVSAKISAGAIDGVTLTAEASGCAGTESAARTLTGSDQTLLTAIDGSGTQVVQSGTGCAVAYTVATSGSATLGGPTNVTVLYTLTHTP